MSNSTPTSNLSSPRGEGDFEFHDTAAKSSFGDVIKKPRTIISILLALAVLGLVIWLQQRAISTELPPPKASYELLPNIGLTEGVPIAIKLNQVAIFQISDPLAGGGSADRARQIIENLEGAIQDLVDAPGREITLDERGDYPTIVQSAPDGTGRREIVQPDADDLILAGIEDPKAVARIWAERLTDALKALMFAEPPEFTQRSEFGNALETMLLGARGEHGAISDESLDASFELLSDSQKLALTELPARPGVTTEAALGAVPPAQP
ncbi:MAG: hypothetical protein O3A53_16700 [Acidobacteria bacterium]|nr:hypothetical protein [Acidobacteriota bacterium]MDA1236424.1 hypothetical protein [Acidobacteriota bacterium]